jgi:hypothetical protein
MVTYKNIVDPISPVSIKKYKNKSGKKQGAGVNTQSCRYLLLFCMSDKSMAGYNKSLLFPFIKDVSKIIDAVIKDCNPRIKII